MVLVFDYSDLKSLMTKKGLTLADLSKMTGISTHTLSVHFNKGTPFKADQMIIIGRALELEALDDYFLSAKLKNL